MKKLLFLFLAFTLLSACRDKEQDPDVLPEATQSGKNTGGALVDGKIWVAKIINDAAGGNNDATLYSNSNGVDKIKLVLRNVNNNENQIRINFETSQPLLAGTYNIENNTNNSGFYFINTDTYVTSGLYSGTITITKFDKPNRIISGTFSFKAANLSGQIITITEGRFDKKFLQ